MATHPHSVTLTHTHAHTLCDTRSLTHTLIQTHTHTLTHILSHLHTLTLPLTPLPAGTHQHHLLLQPVLLHADGLTAFEGGGGPVRAGGTSE